MSRVCPNPFKTGYASKAGALQSAARRGRSSEHKPLRAYRCECGEWHLTKTVERG